MSRSDDDKMLRVYLLKNRGSVFYVGCGEDENAEIDQARIFTPRPTHTTNMIRYLWRNGLQPEIEVVLSTPDIQQAEQTQKELILIHGGRKLTNKRRNGV